MSCIRLIEVWKVCMKTKGYVKWGDTQPRNTKPYIVAGL